MATKKKLKKKRLKRRKGSPHRLDVRLSLPTRSRDTTPQITWTDTKHGISAIPTVPSALPPVNAEFLLHALLSKEEQEAAIGDFLEHYARRLARLGERRARIWAYAEALRTVWPVVKRAMAKISGISGTIAAAEWVRRHFS
jgi:hypothetical protein